MARGHLFLALGLAGCGPLRDPRSGSLPTQLSLLVEDLQGRPLSIVMDLRRNTRQQVDVRVSEGMRLFDGEHVWLFAPREEGGEHVMRLSDERAGHMRDLPFRSAVAPRLVAVAKMEAWFESDQGLVRCALLRPVCGPDASPPERPLDHDGPGRGFRAWLTGSGQIRLTLPLDPDDAGHPILDDVSRVIGVHWVHEGFLARDPMLDHTFRGRGSIVADHHAVELDGELREWDVAEPLVVESPWQVEAGVEEWWGESDASFSVTATRARDGACFAGRVRDDEFSPDDKLTLRVAGVETNVGMGPGAGPVSAVREEWYGRRFEACVALPSQPDRVAFQAIYADSDGADPTTLLTSAPMGADTPAGVLRFSP